ncbi:hypothetical protein Poli38472_004207 [Pythium oligandrum]|uniref:Uncharacterized protein n=1 Tax=Pythium oligandrum TaxID=41045 RepID=A0A8K1CMT6_PYTOL|nr:hypothetical protein Poli38472_004207 [Pythium oligandrum]|eukprot:TMW66442.1 hypothetical protein Poli38472_004207 [Pythium oligandrum]
MGAGPSMAKLLKSMDDNELLALVEDAYRLDPHRMDKIVALAKMRALQRDSTEVALSALVAQTTALPAASISAITATTKPLSIEAVESSVIALSAMQPMSGLATPAANTASSNQTPATTTSNDRMAALWTFEGHKLRELKCAAEMSKKRGAPGSDPPSPTAMVDEDGYPILTGSCGREKKYARCSVCYFRGARRNTAHYCACCQRPVCIRPRTYPGEEQPKICWNVLHMDKEMIQRVEKRRMRRIQVASLTAEKPLTSDDEVVARSNPMLNEGPLESKPQRQKTAGHSISMSVATETSSDGGVRNIVDI